MHNVLHLDLTVDLSTDSDLEAGAAQVLSKVRPDWTQDQLTWKLFTDGITNKLIGAWHKGNKEDTVLIRVYGIGTEAIIDRRIEIENMQKLQVMGVGSRLYACFKNGIAYEFIHGTLLTQEMTREPVVLSCVARMMAKLHTVDTCGNELSLWSRLEKFIQLCPEKLSDPVQQVKYSQEYFSRSELWEEYNMLKNLLENSSSPIVFCHYDALLANIIYQQEKNRVLFIDMEYGGPGPAAFDIANHMNEHVGCEGQLDYNRWYPDRSYQLNWIQIYLTEYNRLRGVPEPNKTEIESTYDLVQKFSLCSHLLWSCWCMIQATSSNIDFDFVGYGVQRRAEYDRLKAKLGL